MFPLHIAACRVLQRKNGVYVSDNDIDLTVKINGDQKAQNYSIKGKEQHAV